MSDTLTENKQQLSPNIHFINTEHMDDSIEEIWPHAKDADVILLEMVAEASFRQDLEGIINYAANSENTEDKERAMGAIDSAVDRQLFKDIAKRVIESGKEIYLIDVNVGEKSQIDTDRAFSANQDTLNFFNDGDYQSSLLSYIKFINLLANSSKEREEITANEIQGILDQNKAEWNGKNIAVIQGAIHTRTYHQIKNDNPDTKVDRTYTKSEYYYPQNMALVRRIIFDKPVSTNDYRRGYLSYLLITDALIDTKGNTLTDPELFRASSRIAWKISDDDLEKYWTELEDGKLDPKELVNKYF